MTIIQKLTTESVLKTLLIETVRSGIKSAQLEASAESNLERQRHNEGVSVAAGILASILPGVCPAQVRNAFSNITEDVIFPYGKIDENDVVMVIELSNKSEVVI